MPSHADLTPTAFSRAGWRDAIGRSSRVIRRLKLGAVWAIVCLIVGLCLSSMLNAQAGEAQLGAVVPVSPGLCDSMRLHNVINVDSPVSCARLSLINFSYSDFEGRIHNDGEMVVMDVVAEHVLQIFNKLRDAHFPIAKARLMDHYEGNDDASMADNNTSAFNSRRIVGGNSISMHAFGLAIDVNPVRNPYAKRTGDRLTFKPPAGAEYANRLNDRPGKTTRAGMAEAAVDVFADDGFLIWGGFWDDPIDYQHFQVNGALAEQLSRLSPAQAKTTFDQYVERYRACRRSAAPDSSRSKCILASDTNTKPAAPVGLFTR